MPWSQGDFPTAFKNLSKTKRAKALSIANGVLNTCLRKGGSDETCAPRAIRIALSKVKESEMPKQNLEEKYVNRQWDNSKSDYSLAQLKRAVTKAIATHAAALAKDQEDKEINKDDLKLRYKEPNGDINIEGVRAALRRLPQTKGLSDSILSSAKKELESALTKAKKALGIKESFKEDLTWEVSIAEDAINVEELDGKRLIKADVTLIESGWSKNKRYYSDNVLRKAAPLFERIGSFDSHVEDPKVSDYVAFYENVRFNSAKGSVRGTLNVFDEKLQKVLEHAPHLVKLSISGAADLVRGTVEERSGWIVEDIVSARSCDVVVAAGAGGGINAVLEAVKTKEDNNMEITNTEGLREAYPDLTKSIEDAVTESLQDKDKDTEIADLQETVKNKDDKISKLNDEQKELEKKIAVFESRDVLDESLVDEDGKPRLPKAAEKRIREAFEDEIAKEDAVKTAVKAEQDYLKEISEEKPVKGVKPEKDPLDESNKDYKRRLRNLIVGEDDNEEGEE